METKSCSKFNLPVNFVSYLSVSLEVFFPPGSKTGLLEPQGFIGLVVLYMKQLKLMKMVN